MTQTISASVARQQFSQLLNRVFRRESRVLIEKSGIPVAAIVTAEDLERLTQLDRQRERGMAATRRMRQAFRDVPPEEIEREIEKAIAEVRAERRDAAGV
jgi:prevent-host-death family protein